MKNPGEINFFPTTMGENVLIQGVFISVLCQLDMYSRISIVHYTVYFKCANISGYKHES